MGEAFARWQDSIAAWSGHEEMVEMLNSGFMRVWGMHFGDYGEGALGVILGVVSIRRARRRIKHQ